MADDGTGVLACDQEVPGVPVTAMAAAEQQRLKAAADTAEEQQHGSSRKQKQLVSSE